MNNKEKVLLLIIMIALGALVGKSLIFDEVNGLTGQDQIFKEDINKAIEENFNEGFIQYRLVKIKKTKTETQLEYVGTVRKYILGVFPFSQMRIQINYDLEEIYNES